MSWRSSGVTKGDGDSSITFWCRRITERMKRFRAGVAPRGRQLGLLLYQTHALSSASRDGFEQHWVAKFPRDALGFLQALDRILDAGDHRHACARGDLTRGGFRSKAFHCFG